MTILQAALSERVPRPVALHRVIIAASIGNALEWFDIIIYGNFAAPIAKAYFPAEDQTTSLLVTFGAFGVPYLIRPLGAIVLGAYADRAGRKASLMLSIVLMMIGTFLMAAMPSYATIGILAPIGILLARFVQGFSVGGEFGSATAFMVEHVPGRKGFLASWQFASQSLSFLLASAAGYCLSTLLAPAQFDEWGWRLPFLFGLLVGPVGLYIRRHLDETPQFLAATPSKTPVRDVAQHQAARVLLAAGTLALGTGVTYITLYMPTYAVQQLGLPISSGFLGGIASSVIALSVTPVVGHWSDRVGRLPIMLAMTALILVAVLPAFLFLTLNPTTASVIVVVAAISLAKSISTAPLPALLAEMFPVETRGTGMSLGYNIGVAVFGGFAPLATTWLIRATGSSLAPGFYLMGTAAVTLLTLWVIRKRLPLYD